DGHVTGVQTCALPILIASAALTTLLGLGVWFDLRPEPRNGQHIRDPPAAEVEPHAKTEQRGKRCTRDHKPRPVLRHPGPEGSRRSEERRVGELGVSGG